MSNIRLTRRGMLRGTAGLAAAAMTSRWTAAAAAAAPSPREMIWDCHGHLSGLAGTVEQSVERLLKSVPHTQVVFDSHLPLFALESAVLKLKESSLPPEQETAIRHGNAPRLLASTPGAEKPAND